MHSPKKKALPLPERAKALQVHVAPAILHRIEIRKIAGGTPALRHHFR